jgi:hypothetical protein
MTKICSQFECDFIAEQSGREDKLVSLDGSGELCKN